MKPIFIFVFFLMSTLFSPAWATDEDTLKELDISTRQLQESKQGVKSIAEKLYSQLENADSPEKITEELVDIKGQIEKLNQQILSNETEKGRLLELIAARNRNCDSGNCFDGLGRRRFSNGSYTGEFLNGVFHGKGAYAFSNGSSYSGDWENGKIQGNCIYMHPSGVTEEGKCSEVENVIKFQPKSIDSSTNVSQAESEKTDTGFFATIWGYTKKIFVFLLQCAFWIFLLWLVVTIYKKYMENTGVQTEQQAVARRETERLTEIQRQEQVHQREAEAQRQREIERQRVEAEAQRQEEARQREITNQRQREIERQRMAEISTSINRNYLHNGEIPPELI